MCEFHDIYLFSMLFRFVIQARGRLRGSDIIEIKMKQVGCGINVGGIYV